MNVNNNNTNNSGRSRSGSNLSKAGYSSHSNNSNTTSAKSRRTATKRPKGVIQQRSFPIPPSAKKFTTKQAQRLLHMAKGLKNKKGRKRYPHLPHKPFLEENLQKLQIRKKRNPK